MAYKKSNANWQATMANSEPVVIASDQTAIPVTATNLDVQSWWEDLATSTQAWAIQTAVQLIDDTVQLFWTNTYTEEWSKGIAICAVRRDADTSLVNTTNEFWPLQINATGSLKTAITAALPAWTNWIWKLTANSWVDIWDVDVLTVWTITPWTAATSLWKAEDAVHNSWDVWVFSLWVANEAQTSLAADGDYIAIATDVKWNTLAVGNIANDTADAGNPVKIGFKAYEIDWTAPQTAVAEADRVNWISDLVGRQYVATEHPRFWHVSVDYSSAQTNASVKWTPWASLALYITDIMISNWATAGNITLLDWSWWTVLFEIYPWVNWWVALNLKNPIKLTDNTALCLTSTTVTTHSAFISWFID